MLSATSWTSKTLLTSYNAFALLKGRDNSQYDVVLGVATHLRIHLGPLIFSWLLSSIKIFFVMRPRRRGTVS